MSKIKFLMLITVFFGTTQVSKVVGQSNNKNKIAIFSPLYLDSAYTESGQYRYGRNSLPKFINPGLEFYEGVQIALDSLNTENAPLEVFIYDTKSSTETLADQLYKCEQDSVELIIAYCSGNEVKTFADAGLKRNIPVINVNIPNNGGATANPYFVLLNPTLKTQCEGIYKYMQKYFSLDQLVVFRKKGVLEDRIKMYFDDYAKSTMSLPLGLKYVDLNENFTETELVKYLDSTKLNLCIAGSLDENFGKTLTQQLANIKKQNYEVTVMGMPTWDGINDFGKPAYKGIEIIYSTPFYNSRNDKISKSIIAYYNKVMYARPSDMVLRGYESMWRFGKLLTHYKSDISSNITNQNFNVIREFDIQPVLDQKTMMLDYFENKKLYFLRWQDGVLKNVY